MKKTAIRILAVIMAIVLILPVLAGCRRESDELYVPPEFVFMPEAIPLPDGIWNISNVAYANDTIYFAAYIVLDMDTWETTTKIFHMNIDGTNVEELTNYDSGGSQYEDAMGHMDLSSLNVDSDGNIWVVENGWFYRLNIPEDFDGEEHETWQFYEDLGQVMQVRKLDNTGAEILTMDVSALSRDSDWFQINTMNIDDFGNIYLGTNNDIFVLNKDGSVLFKLEVNDWVDRLIRISDGSIAYFMWTETGRILRKIDPVTRAFGDTIEVPPNAWDIFPGGGKYAFIFQDGNNLYGVEEESGEVVRLLNWVESNVAGTNLSNISVLPDGRVICTNSSWNRRTQESNFELVVLSQIPYADLPERTIITFATLWLDWDLRSHIVDFNMTNQTYRIHVIDYSEFNTEDDWNAGLTRLTTEIIAGRVPDILSVSNLPFNQYVARGVLADLYPMIDADPDFSRSDFMETVFRAAEMDGSLYRIFPSFLVSTIIGHPSVVGEGMGWTAEEFLAVLDANPQADMPMGSWLTSENFIQQAVWFSIDEFVDWATGEVRFDTGAFAQLLEFSSRFPESYEDDFGFGRMVVTSDIGMEDDPIAQGRQIMEQAWVYSIQDLRWQRMNFGGEFVFKGFPTANRDGNAFQINSSLAITSNSNNKEGAWEFIRTMLTKDWQLDSVWGFPTNKAAFYTLVEEAMTEPEYPDIWYIGGEEVVMGAVTQEQVDQVIELIESVNNIASWDTALMNIIMEGAQDFFSGRSTAQEAARVVQNRANTYVSERS